MTKKTVNGVTTKYAINDNNIIAEQKGTDASSRITYFYGLDGVTAFKYANAVYYYKKNFLGDIIGIYDSSKQLVAKYVYDAWGNHKIFALIEGAFVDVTEHIITAETTPNEKVALINPFRYRSYYFDVETGFYYLQSRYYDPEVGRFISMDSVEYLAPETINGLNLYAYCLNDPVNKNDPEGTSWNSFWNGVGDWFGRTFGAAYVTTKTESKDLLTYPIFKIEAGVIIKNISTEQKPITFFLEKPVEDFWSFFKTKVGVSVAMGKFKLNIGRSLSSANISIGWDDYMFNLSSDIKSINAGFSYTQGNSTVYTNFSFTPWTAIFFAATACLPVSMPTYKPVLSPAYA